MQTASHQKKVLVVEDEAPLAKLLMVVLRRRGYLVEYAENGKEGLEKALAWHPDLIFLDILMPVMNGIDMLRMLRVDAWGATVPVIVWSNSNVPALVRELESRGVTDFFVKSDVGVDQIAERAKQVLG